MNDKGLTKTDFPKVCLICLELPEILLLMIPEISKVYESMTGILIKENESLPQNICIDCNKELEKIETFIKKCKNSHSILKKFSKIFFDDNANNERNNEAIDISTEDFSVDDSTISIESTKDEESNVNQEHSEESSGKMPFCETCDKTYSSLANLKRHKDTFHWLDQLEKNNKERLEKKFIKRRKSHNINNLHLDNTSTECIRVPTEQECKICKKLIPKKEFMSHVNEHLPQTIQAKSKHKKEYICSVCNKNMKSKSHLDAHSRTHSGDRPFECKICYKSFATNATLASHLMHHTGEKPFLCHQCARLFRSKKALDFHVTTHTGEKKFQCDTCGKQYYNKNDLEKHLHIHTHNQQISENLECNICKKTFNNLYWYKLHTSSHSKERKYLCTTCGKFFKTKAVLTVHSRIHTGETPYVCGCCYKGFISKTQMKEHIRRRHTGEQPYFCNVCPKRFFDGTNLRRHKKRNHPDLNETKM